MEKHIAPLAKTPVRGAGKSTDMYVAFSDPDTGKSISFTRKGTKRNSEFLAHKFVDRNYQIPDEVLDVAFTLDECVNHSTYDEINLAFQGGGGDVAPTVEEAPAPQPSAAPAESRLRTRTPAPAAEPPTPAPDANPTPVATPRTRTTAAPGTVGTQVCPVGGIFGADCEKYNECATCTVWDDCSAEKDKIDAAGAATPATPTPRPTPSAPATPRPTPRPAATPAAAPAATTPGPRRGLRPRG
jgi:hypothetical protein